MVKAGIFYFMLCLNYGCAILLSASIVGGSSRLQPENNGVQADGRLGGRRVLAGDAALIVKATIRFTWLLILFIGIVVVALFGMCVCLCEKSKNRKSGVVPESENKGSTELTDVRVDSQT